MAVKRDRAADALLTIGSKFVVNILAEGQEKPVIKQLLKKFKPGEDRFEGLDIQVHTAHQPHRDKCPAIGRSMCVAKQLLRGADLHNCEGLQKCLLPTWWATSLSHDGWHLCLSLVQVSEATGCAILPGTAAYLECSVSDKMEAGDHWIVYATVDDGKVTEEGALSAVHHRKIGTTY